LEFDTKAVNVSIFNIVENEIKIQAPEKWLMWAACVQGNQDQGESWSDAVGRADESYRVTENK